MNSDISFFLHHNGWLNTFKDTFIKDDMKVVDNGFYARKNERWYFKSFFRDKEELRLLIIHHNTDLI